MIGEIKRHTEVVGIFPNEDGITRLVGPSSWSSTMNGPYRGRYMILEIIAPMRDDPLVSILATRQLRSPA